LPEFTKVNPASAICLHRATVVSLGGGGQKKPTGYVSSASSADTAFVG
jgi:hypothetical protein